MQPKVSIVTPSFNQAAFLEKTIRSVIEQDYPDLEYLVVDGASTDDSIEIIQKYKKNITWWVSEPDQGQADAINKGLQRTTGDIVAWLNSDDTYLLGTIAKVVAFFDQHPEVGFVFGDLLAIDEHDEVINTIRYGDYTLQDLMTFHIIGQPSAFFRRDTMRQAGLLDLDYQFLLDHQLWLRMASVTQIAYIPSVLAAARYHSAAKNVAAAEQFGEEAYRIVEWMRTNPATSAVLPSIEKKVIAGACLIDGRYLLDGGQAWRSFKVYLRSLCLHPPTGVREIHRMLFALLAALRLVRVENVVDRRRKMNKMKSLFTRRK